MVSTDIKETFNGFGNAIEYLEDMKEDSHIKQQGSCL